MGIEEFVQQRCGLHLHNAIKSFETGGVLGHLKKLLSPKPCKLLLIYLLLILAYELQTLRPSPGGANNSKQPNLQ